MQIIKDILQNSDEWIQLRLGVATASNFDKIITPGGKESATLSKYANKTLALELFYEKLKEAEHISLAMQAGKDYEPEARQLYQEKTFNIVEEITMFKSDCGNFGYSPDGLVGDDGLIEIKNLEADAHSEVLINKKMPNDYIPQVQGGLWVSGRKWCDFIAYNRYCKNPLKKLIVIRIERNDAYISQLEILAKKTILLRDEKLKQLEDK